MEGSIAGILVQGHPKKPFAPPYKEEDSAFIGDRLDGQTISDCDYKHCVFAGISFKATSVSNADFVNCVFYDCYFRRAEFANVRFVGCRFIYCNFAHIALKNSDFAHSIFRGCQVPYCELLHSLPSEPNLREELARNLALESSKLGLSGEARRYRMQEIKAREANLRAAVKGESKWYQEHYKGFNRVRAGLDLVASWINRVAWGYGEQSWVLFRNVLLLTVVIFPLFYYLCLDGLSLSSGGKIDPLSLVSFSVESILPGGYRSGIIAISFATKIAAAIERMIGILSITLFASYVFRWSIHR